jgi:hypothetical protein
LKDVPASPGNYAFHDPDKPPRHVSQPISVQLNEV